MAKLLTVEDETAIRELLAFICETDGHEVVKAASLAEAREALRRGGLDLILLDVMLPDGSGFDFLREVRTDAASASVPVVMITARGDEADRVEGLDAGADDYVVKPFSMRELLARVKAVLRRSAKDSQSEKGREETLKIGGLRLDFSSYQAWLHDEPIALTPKEYELLKLLVTNPGRAFTRDELLERIWGYEYYGDTRTVDVHIRHLRAKLKGDENISKAIETVRGIGYRFARRRA